MRKSITNGLVTLIGGLSIFSLATETGRPQQAPAAKTWNFDGDAVDRLPAGFTSERTGRGPRGRWSVTADPAAPSKPNVLTQKSETDMEYRMPVAFVGDSKYGDLKLSVRFKILGGKIDQSAGLVFRSRNESNYYLLRASAMDKDNQFRLFHVVEGRRVGVKGVALRLPLNEWHSMSVEVKGKHFRCYFDDQLKFEADDPTITVQGRIGVWTRADAAASFDDLTVQ